MFDQIAGILSGTLARAPGVLLGVAIGTALLLFSGDYFIDLLGLQGFISENRPYLGIAFIFSLAVLLAQCAYAGWGLVEAELERRKKRARKAKELKFKHEMLDILLPDERAYLWRYIHENRATQTFLLDDGVAGGLEIKKIIYKGASVGYQGLGWEYNLQPWARAYLNDNPHLLETNVALPPDGYG